MEDYNGIVSTNDDDNTIDYNNLNSFINYNKKIAHNITKYCKENNFITHYNEQRIIFFLLLNN